MEPTGIAPAIDQPSKIFGVDRIRQDVDLVTVRLNYRFGGYGAPFAARH